MGLRSFLESKQSILLSPPAQPFFLPPPPPPPQSHGFNLNEKVSPSILLIIIILAIIFFISGLLHLLVRFLLRPPLRDPDDFDNVTALQGQLQQLFNLHDSGVDQSFIDTLPVFNYKSIIGIKKNPFDCAVCLCEFEAEDKLRLLPQCSHAFHMDCIDTWLLSHSTCPLCRGSLLPDFSPRGSFSPIVFVLESGSESSREIVADPNANSVQRANSQLGSSCCAQDFEFLKPDVQSKSGEIKGSEEENKEKVVTVKLGKFKSVDVVGEGSSENSKSIDARRCFSMGSFEYVMDEESSLQVPIRTPVKKQSSKKCPLPLVPGHRAAMSECGGDSMREFNSLEAFKNVGLRGDSTSNTNNGNVGRSKRSESFSISRIWLRGKRDRTNSTVGESSSRTFSFRFPFRSNVANGDESRPKNVGSLSRRTISEVDIGTLENGGSSELVCDEEVQSHQSFDSETNTPSMPKRTLLWLMSRQNKVVHSTFSSNV